MTAMATGTKIKWRAWLTALAVAGLILPLAACEEEKDEASADPPQSVAVAAETQIARTKDADERNELVIGIGQFPAGFHPNLFAHVAQSLILGAARRPFTAYDPSWQLICMLCVELPSVENGTAREWVSPEGELGWELDYEIRADAVWGDGTPITTDDVLFTWEVGRHEESGTSSFDLYSRIEKVEIHDERRFTFFNNKRTCDFEGINFFQPLPAHLDREAFAEPREYKTRTSDQILPVVGRADETPPDR